MPKLIKIDKGQQKKTTHSDCGAVISYFKNEVQSAVHYDYGGGSDTWYYIICPNCGKKVEVSR